MPARYNFEVDTRCTWHRRIRYVQPAATSRDVRKPVNLTGWDAILQAKTAVTDQDPLFTISTRVADDPDVELDPLGEDGIVEWAIDMSTVDDLPARAFYELMLIDPDGLPRLVLRGQLLFVQGVIDGP